MKNQKGITLVALVITIIVLLILAGVSISLVVGQNGVLGKATGSVKAQKASAIKEAVSLGIGALETEYNAKWATDQSITRASVYTVTDLQTELGSSYTVSAMRGGAAATELIGTEMVLTVKKGSDDVEMTMTIDTTGSITWGTIRIKDNGNYQNVNNI